MERALEVTKKYGARFKPPKTERGKRTIALDDVSLAILLKERERHLRIRAGVPQGVEVDLSLVRLPADALIFPEPGTFTTPRNPPQFQQRICQAGEKARLCRFHLPPFSRHPCDPTP